MLYLLCQEISKHRDSAHLSLMPRLMTCVGKQQGYVVPRNSKNKMRGTGVLFVHSNKVS